MQLKMHSIEVIDFGMCRIWMKCFLVEAKPDVLIYEKPRKIYVTLLDGKNPIIACVNL